MGKIGEMPPHRKVALSYWSLCIFHFILFEVGVGGGAVELFLLLLSDTLTALSFYALFAVSIFKRDTVCAQFSLIMSVSVFAPAFWHWWQFMDLAMTT